MRPTDFFIHIVYEEHYLYTCDNILYYISIELYTVHRIIVIVHTVNTKT